jgi:hypothetical protein
MIKKWAANWQPIFFIFFCTALKGRAKKFIQKFKGFKM